MIHTPRIALVGRPNVGKSTLFNRICGQRKAIVDSRPGSTRDRNYAQTEWDGRGFELIDTGGLLLASDDPLLGPASAQAERAIDEADLVVLVVDARAGLLPDDEGIARQLRRKGRRVIVAANKVEGRIDVSEFSRLGFEVLLPISAEHSRGIDDLLEAALARLPEGPGAASPGGVLPVAIVGRPNVGKSSMLNRLLGSDRALVSTIAGTTRDAVDSELVRDGRRYRLVDTAGIRKVRALKQGVDHVSVVLAKRSIERADVVVLVVDAGAGVVDMDATIAGYATEAGRGVVIAANKWDLARARGVKPELLHQDLRDRLKFLAWAPIVNTSATEGRGMGSLLETVDKVAESQRTRVATGPLNRAIAKAVAEHPPASRGKQPVRVLFGSQIGVLPPTFALSLSQAVSLHFSYLRYLENRLRDAFGFEGTPIVLKTRRRRH
jgi:GTP-binding protein